MKKILLTTLLLISVILLSSCTRSASTPLPASILSENETVFPVQTQLGATMTPMQGQAATLAPVIEATATPLIVVPTEQPTVEPQPEQPEQVSQEQEEAPSTEQSNEVPGGCSPGITPYEGMGPGFPTFGICGVIKDVSVTVQTNDYLPGQDYTVYMGSYDSGAIGGIVIGTYNTNNGGRYVEIYPIPDSLKGLNRISIRIEFSSGWYATNFFYNQTTN